MNTTIPQRLRSLANVLQEGGLEMNASKLLEIAAELEAPAADAAKPLDDQRLQELFGCAIDGALTSGYQGVSPAPEGHWLKPWWGRGRVVAEHEQELQARINELEERQVPALGTVYPPLQGATLAGMVELAKRESMLDMGHGYKPCREYGPNGEPPQPDTRKEQP